MGHEQTFHGSHATDKPGLEQIEDALQGTVTLTEEDVSQALNSLGTL